MLTRAAVLVSDHALMKEGSVCGWGRGGVEEGEGEVEGRGGKESVRSLSVRSLPTMKECSERSRNLPCIFCSTFPSSVLQHFP